MKLTEYLNVEHGVILALLRHLEMLLDHKVPRKVLATAADMVAKVIDAHRDIEEMLLYPALEEVLGPENFSIETRKHEHGSAQQIADAIHAGTVDNSQVRTFIGLLQNHIAEEIHDLFPMAEKTIPAEKLEALTRRALDRIYDRAEVWISR